MGNSGYTHAQVGVMVVAFIVMTVAFIVAPIVALEVLPDYSVGCPPGHTVLTHSACFR